MGYLFIDYVFVYMFFMIQALTFLFVVQRYACVLDFVFVHVGFWEQEKFNGDG